MDVSTEKRRSSSTQFVQFLKRNHNKEYIKSPSGIIKMARIVSMVTSFSALAHFNILGSTTSLIFYVFMSSSVVICVTDILMYTGFVLSLDYQLIKLSPRGFKIAIITYTVTVGTVLFILSFLLAVEADQVRNNANHDHDQKCLKCGKINIAAVFGFFSWLLFIVELVQQVVQHKREAQTKEEVTHTAVTDFKPDEL